MFVCFRVTFRRLFFAKMGNAVYLPARGGLAVRFGFNKSPDRGYCYSDVAFVFLGCLFLCCAASLSSPKVTKVFCVFLLNLFRAWRFSVSVRAYLGGQ